MRIRYLMVLLLVALIAIATTVWHLITARPQKSTPSDQTESITDVKVIEKPLTETPLLKDEKRFENYPKEKYRIDIIYPSVILATEPLTATQASDVLKGAINRQVESFLKDIKDLGPGIPDDMTSDLTIRYSEGMLSPIIMSVRFENSSYIRGAAHPLSQPSVLHYDLTNHTLLETGDLFIPGNDYLGILSDISRTKLKSQLSDISNEEYANQVIPGTEPKEDNFKVVIPEQDGLHIVFAPYQVAPYARGTIEVVVPYNEIHTKLTEHMQQSIDRAFSQKQHPTENSSTTTNFVPEGSDTN